MNFLDKLDKVILENQISPAMAEVDDLDDLPDVLQPTDDMVRFDDPESPEIFGEVFVDISDALVGINLDTLFRDPSRYIETIDGDYEYNTDGEIINIPWEARPVKALTNNGRTIVQFEYY